MAPPLRARPLPAGAIVVADLHLDLAAERAPAEFLAWLARLDAPELVILGDLADVWVGPAQARLPAARAVLDALAARVRAGTAVSVVPGNRDFLLGQAFVAATGAELWPAGFVAELPGGGLVVCVHGDELCTRDRGYQRLRAVVRSRPVGWLARHLPLFAGLALARRLRRASARALASKPAPEQAVQPAAAAALARASGARLVLCGHAHGWRDERLEDPVGTRWIVLDAFGGSRSALTLAAGGQVLAGSVRGPDGPDLAADPDLVADPDPSADPDLSADRADPVEGRAGSAGGATEGARSEGDGGPRR